MRYFVQLKLLIWKNWILRKRNKGNAFAFPEHMGVVPGYVGLTPTKTLTVCLLLATEAWMLRTAIEFIWPTVIFLFLILLHNLGVRRTVSNCYFKPKAMPSAGELLFIQTLICSFNNTCDKFENSTMEEYDQSLLSNLGLTLKEGFDLEEINDNTGKRSTTDDKYGRGTRRKLMRRIKKAQYFPDSSCAGGKKLMENSEDRGWLRDIFVLGCLTDVLRGASSAIRNPFFAPIEEDEKLPQRIERDVERGEVEIMAKGKRAIMARTMFHSLLQYSQSENNANGSVNFFTFLDALFCGPKVPPFMDQIRSVLAERSFRKYSLKESMEESRLVKTNWESDTTDFCNELMENFSSEESYKIIFGLIKPFFRGKILYVPDAPVINGIMSRINETISKLKYVKDLIDDLSQCNRTEDWTLYHVLTKYRNDRRLLKKIVEKDAGKEILKYYGRKSVGNVNDPRVLREDAEAFGEIIQESAEHLRQSMNNSTRIFGFRQLKSYLECIDFNRIIPMPNEEKAVNESLKWLKSDRFAALIVFLNISRETEKLPPSLTYKIRTGIERTPKTTQIRDRVYVTGVKRNVFQDLKHITGGFSYLQNLIETELIREYTGNKKAPGIYLQQMPFPCHIHDSFMHIITRTLPVFMVISWCYTFGMIVKKIVAEKESHLKGTMRIFGVYSSQHWIAWFVDAYVPVLIISLILSAMLVFGNVIPNSDYFLIWLFIVMFALPTISFAFLVSVCFTKSSFALNVSMVIFFLLYLIYPPIQNFGEDIDPNLKSMACIVSNVAFGLGCTWIANMEEIGLGARFTHINYSPIPGNPISMGFVLQMFLLDSAIYLLIALYLENVYRAEESVRLPWNYIFTSNYWKNVPKMKENSPSPRYKFGADESRFEPEPDLPVGIETINLTKEFGKGENRRKVVNNLTMKFYENQITSFLGHNGAGKTTSISMMSGLSPITSGVVLIYGVNLEKNPEIAGKDIGICRQENVLVDELTVEEHLWLFSRLKNRSVEETKKDAEKIIEDLQLEQRAKSPVRNLSGGMKRKVCLAMAFIGGPRTIFLDEPTAGVDPSSRRSIWNLLIKYKQGRTLILTTHFLDEADLLGDRIAIIANGKLQCCGSSVFLKNNFGRGYYLTVERKITTERMGREFYGRKNDGCVSLSPQADELNTLITGIIPEAEFLEEIGTEIIFILPLRTNPSAYDELFTALNNAKKALNLLSYGISNTSLVEVFFTITREVDKTEENLNYETFSKLDTFYEKIAEIEPAPGKEKIGSGKGIESGLTERALDTKIGKIITQQFFALLIKRFSHHRRNYKLLIIEILLPAIFIAIALTLVLTLPTIQVMPPLTIDVSAYAPSLIFYKRNFPNDPILDSYEKALLGPFGLGTKCILSPEKCNLHTISERDYGQVGKFDIIKNCSCDNGNYFCNLNGNYGEPQKSEMSSGDLLYNLTSQDLVNWLLTTELNLSDIRYGGMELGYYNVWSGVTVDAFFNLFMIKKFISLMMQVPEGRGTPFEIEILSNFLISFSYNRTYGDELFKKRNPSDNIVVWYNNRGWIAGMAFMNGISNLVLRALLPKNEDPSKYSIKLVNHPLPITERQLEEDIEMQINTSLLTAIAIIWALSFIPAMFAIYIVEERMSGLKHLQIVSGISKSVYWMVALIWDMTLYSVNVLTIVVLFFAFDIQTYINEDSFTTFLLLLYVYGFANISFVYAVSYMFVTPSIAFVFVACYNIFVGMITLWTTFFLDLISSRDDPLFLKKIFLIFPPFCFGRGLVKMALAYNSGQTMKTFGLTSHVNYAAWSISSKYLVVMICLGVIFFATTILIQFRFFSERFNFGKVRRRNGNRDEEEDVREERLRVESGEAERSGDMLVVSNLTKCYAHPEIPTVDRICFGVKRGECFGLLGLNGAGKTTVFKMLTGCLPITDGDALIRGYSLKRNLRKIRLLMGYCPQGDALDPYLTCEEHLSLFSRIRGITGAKKEEMIDLNIKRLGLTPHRHKIVKVLSGGNKRKLNTAIAFMGEPQVVLLDEPTSGMDSQSRRFVWKCIQRIVNEGRCVVLTSHNMEECQALCTKLSIMVRGSLKCFGSCQHLKSKFDDGYNITIRMGNSSDAEKVEHYIREKIPKCTLVYVNYPEMRFRLFAPTHLGLAFKVLNEAKNNNLIQDYSLSQTTLENVFLKLASNVEHTVPTSTFGYLETFCSSLCK